MGKVLHAVLILSLESNETSMKILVLCQIMNLPIVSPEAIPTKQKVAFRIKNHTFAPKHNQHESKHTQQF